MSGATNAKSAFARRSCSRQGAYRSIADAGQDGTEGVRQLQRGAFEIHQAAVLGSLERRRYWLGVADDVLAAIRIDGVVADFISTSSIGFLVQAWVT